MTRRRTRSSLEPSALLGELAATDDPPTELAAYVGRLRNSGATMVRVETQTEKGAQFEIFSAEQARAGSSVVTTENPRVRVSQVIDWRGSGTPLRDALDRLVEEFVVYDQITRFRLAASDMKLVAHAATGLIDAADQRGSARVFARVIETGMVVTYARPFLPSGEAHLGRRWWPKDEAGRALHGELVDLRGEYHAHAEHTPQRRLNFLSGVTRSGRPLLAEEWTLLSVDTLRLLQELATRQAERFEAEAERLDLELFGPRDGPAGGGLAG